MVDTWFWIGFGNFARHVQIRSNLKCYFNKESQSFRGFFVQIIERGYT